MNFGESVADLVFDPLFFKLKNTSDSTNASKFNGARNQTVTVSDAFLQAGSGGSLFQIQADWNESDPSQVDFIKNKPTIPLAQATEALAAAAASASNAANSATSASASATSASSSASNASTSASNAANSATSASSSASNAANSATNAAASASNAANSETNAATSASNAATQALNAGASKLLASSSATNAATSATNAATSATSASTSATNASSSASTATTQATNASTSATSASSSASTATTQATNAATSATNAAASASAAAASASSISSFTSSSTRWVVTNAFGQNLTNYVYYKIATLKQADNVGNAATLLIKGTLGDWGSLRTSVDAYIKTRGGLIYGGLLSGYGTPSSTQSPSDNCDIVIYCETGGATPTLTYTVYLRCRYYYYFDFEMNGTATDNLGISVLAPSTTTSSPTGSPLTQTLISKCMQSLITTYDFKTGLGISDSTLPQATLDVRGNAIVSGSLLTNGFVDVLGGDQGDFISKRYGAADRYGFGQYAMGTVRVFTSGTFGAGTIRFSKPTDDNRSGSGGFTDMVTILNTGNMGIGLVNPSAPLHIYKATSGNVVGGEIRVCSDGSGISRVGCYEDQAGAYWGAWLQYNGDNGLNGSDYIQIGGKRNGVDTALVHINPDTGAVGIGEKPAGTYGLTVSATTGSNGSIILGGTEIRFVNGFATIVTVNGLNITNSANSTGSYVRIRGYDPTLSSYFYTSIISNFFNWNSNQPTWKARTCEVAIDDLAAALFATSIGNPIGDRFIIYNTTGNTNGAYGYYNGGWGSTSDRRVKKNIDTIDEAKSIAFVKALEPRSYEFKEGIQGIQSGFVAQEVLEAAGDYAPFRSIVDNCEYEGDPLLGLSPTKMIPPLVKTIQNLMKRIEVLEAALQNNVT